MRIYLVVALTLSAACFKGSPSQGTCNADTDCAAGSSCDSSLKVCVYACPEVCAAGNQCVNGACKPTDCIPACDISHQCDKTQSPPKCIELQSGVVTVDNPVATKIIGGPQLTVSASAGAPVPGPTKVVFRIEQNSTTKATLTVTTGVQGVYTGTMSLSGSGLVSGAANVIAAVYWTKNGSETSVDSAPVAVTVDEDAPQVTSPSNDQSFYSATAPGAQSNAQVTVQITDVGAAGVDKTTARLNVPGHSYPAQTAPSVGSGAGAYTFSVPVSDLGVATQNSVGYLVTATDKVGNAGSFDGGTIPVDNNPPTITNLSVPTSWFDGGVTVPVSADVADPAGTGSSGLDPSSVKIVLADGVTTFNPGAPSGNTFAFAPDAGSLISDGQQGAVNFTVVAKDTVGNVTTTPTQSVNVDRKPPTAGAGTVTDNPVSTSNGFYARDNTGTPTIAVAVSVSDGNGSGVASATLHAGSSTFSMAFDSVSGNWKVLVPTNVQTPGSETPVPVTVDAKDHVGNALAATAPTNAPALKIDDIGPVVSNVAVNGGDATVSTVKWFKQLDSSGLNTLPDIDVQATIVDNGSGVDPTSLQLQKQGTTTRVDHNTPTADGTTPNVWHFFIPRVGTIAQNAEGTIAFKVVAKDRLGHAQQADAGGNSSLGSVGVDGKPPSLPFTATYPANGTDCDSTLPGGGADLGIVCGHDGSHWWRRGLGTNGAELSAMTYTASDSGSGIDTSSGTCAVTGSAQSCTVTYDTPNSRFAFNPNFSDATLASPDTTTGGGTATVTVTAKDLVGNVATGSSSSVAVSRLRWVQRLTTDGVLTLRGAPIATTQPIKQIIVAGQSASQDPIVALKPTGGIAWSAGKAQGFTTVSNNMAYDVTASSDTNHPTPMLYVLNSTALYGINITSAGAAKYYTCGLTGSVGSPVIATGGAAARILAVDSSAKLVFDFGGTPSSNGTGCDSLGPTRSVQLASPRDQAILGPATIANGTAYYAYDDSGNTSGESGVVSVTLSSSAFTSAPVAHNLSTLPFVGSAYTYIALAGGLFFGDANSKIYHAYTTGFAPSWATTAFSGSTTLAAPMVVARGLALGVSGTSAKIRAYNPQDGTAKWTSSTGLGTISPVVTAADGTIYFSDSQNNEFVALTPGASSATNAWTFKGSTGILVSGAGTEPTIDSDGIVYFGQDSGNVYALITDVGATVPQSTGGDWAKSSFDNCNSGNANYTCQ